MLVQAQKTAAPAVRVALAPRLRASHDIGNFNTNGFRVPIIHFKMFYGEGTVRDGPSIARTQKEKPPKIYEESRSRGVTGLLY